MVLNKKGINAVILVLILSTIAVSLIFIGVFQSYQKLACYLGVDLEDIANPFEYHGRLDDFSFFPFRWEETYRTCIRNCPINCDNIDCEVDCECIPFRKDEDTSFSFMEYLMCEDADCYDKCDDSWCPDPCNRAEDAVLACKTKFREDNSGKFNWEPRKGQACMNFDSCSAEVWSSCSAEQRDSAVESCRLYIENYFAPEQCFGVGCSICDSEVVVPIYCRENFDSYEKNIVKEKCESNPDADPDPAYEACIDFYSSYKNSDACYSECSAYGMDTWGFWSFRILSKVLKPTKFLMQVYMISDDHSSGDRSISLLFSETTNYALGYEDSYFALMKGKQRHDCNMTLRVEVTPLDSQTLEKRTWMLPSDFSERATSYNFCIDKDKSKDIDIEMHSIGKDPKGSPNEFVFSAEYSITGEDIEAVCPNWDIWFMVPSCGYYSDITFLTMRADSRRSDWPEIIPSVVGSGINQKVVVRVPFGVENDVGVAIDTPETAKVKLNFNHPDYTKCEDLVITSQKTMDFMPAYVAEYTKRSDGSCNEVTVEFVISYLHPDPFKGVVFGEGDTHYFYAYVGDGLRAELNFLMDSADAKEFMLSNPPRSYYPVYPIDLTLGNPVELTKIVGKTVELRKLSE